MGFLHSMICQTEGIQSTAPVRWRSYEGLCGVYWEAKGKAGAEGYYLSPDPRIMLFFNDVSQTIRLSEHAGEVNGPWRPMLRALYVPAGMPMWTHFDAPHVFSHLDLHFNRAWLMKRLTLVMGETAAQEALREPTERQDIRALASVAQVMANEIGQPTGGSAFAESLAVSLVTGIIGSISEDDFNVAAQGGLTPHQLRRLYQLFRESEGRLLTNTDLSAAVGLSESWFCHAFKKTTGKTPNQWQQEHRLSLVKNSLSQSDLSIAEIAQRYDFADQGHLTRVFRRYEGTTPSVWRREARSY